jgi:hypothetical protein
MEMALLMQSDLIYTLIPFLNVVALVGLLYVRE